MSSQQEAQEEYPLISLSELSLEDEEPKSFWDDEITPAQRPRVTLSEIYDINLPIKRTNRRRKFFTEYTRGMAGSIEHMLLNMDMIERWIEIYRPQMEQLLIVAEEFSKEEEEEE